MGYRILVVDDHPDAAEIACMLLESFGHDCRAAVTGGDGLREAIGFEPEVAILDIGLPDISGYEVARQLRARYGAAIYLVAVTGWGQPEDQERALAAGFDRHVLKPATAAMLVDVLAGVDRRRAAAH